MAYEIPGFSFTLPAGADFSAGSQFRFCDVSSTGKAINPTAGRNAVGVRYTKSQLNEAATIVHNGIAIVEAGEAITAGAVIATNATGQAMVADTSADVILGRALESASGSGVQIAVLLTGNSASTFA